MGMEYSPREVTPWRIPQTAEIHVARIVRAETDFRGWRNKGELRRKRNRQSRESGGHGPPRTKNGPMGSLLWKIGYWTASVRKVILRGYERDLRLVQNVRPYSVGDANGIGVFTVGTESVRNIVRKDVGLAGCQQKDHGNSCSVFPLGKFFADRLALLNYGGKSIATGHVDSFWRSQADIDVGALEQKSVFSFDNMAGESRMVAVCIREIKHAVAYQKKFLAAKIQVLEMRFGILLECSAPKSPERLFRDAVASVETMKMNESPKTEKA